MLSQSSYQKVDIAYRKFCHEILAGKFPFSLTCADLIQGCNRSIQDFQHTNQCDLVPRFKAMRALANFVYYTVTDDDEHNTGELEIIAAALTPYLDKKTIRNWLRCLCLLQYEYFADRTLRFPIPETKMLFMLPHMFIVRLTYENNLAGINFVSEKINRFIILSKEPMIAANHFQFPGALMTDKDL